MFIFNVNSLTLTAWVFLDALTTFVYMFKNHHMAHGSKTIAHYHYDPSEQAHIINQLRSLVITASSL